MIIKKTARFISFVALFLIPIFPLIVPDSFFFPFIVGKALYFRTLVEIAFAGWIILAFLDPKFRPKWTPLTIGVTVFALVTLLADLLGVNPLRSLWSNFERMEGWITIVHLWAFFITASGLFGAGEEGKRLWHRWINAELIVATVVAIYGLMQLFGVAAIHQGSTRIDASLGNAAYMAVFMLWNTGLAAYMFVVTRARKMGNAGGSAGFLQWAYLILALVFGFEVFQTATRGTILGLIGGILLALFLYAVLGKRESKRNRWTATGVIIVILAIGGIFWANRDAKFIQNSEVLSRMASISWSSATGQARNYIWPMAIKGFMERPVLGWGQENFNYIFNANYNPKMWNQEQWFDRAHGVYLDWLTASGILGLLAYLALYVLCFMAIWKSAHTLAEKSILTGLLTGYAIHNIFVFDNIASYVMFFAALAFTSSFREGRTIRFLGGDKPASAEAVSYIVAPVVLVLLIASLYAFNLRPAQAGTRLIKALQSCAGQTPNVAAFESALAVNVYLANQEIREQVLPCSNRILQSEQTSPVLKQAFYDFTKKEIQNQIEATPNDARVYTLAGSFMNVIARFQDALPLLEKAHELSPAKQSINIEYATALINNGQSELAESILEKDYAAAPENPNVRQVYALALVVRNKEAKARELFDNDPAIFDTLQMAQAYLVAKQPLKAITVYKKLLANNPNDLNAAVSLARLQYTVGQKSAAIQTFRDLQKAFPQYKEAIETAIQQVMQEGQ